MDGVTFCEGWQIVRGWLPADLEERAKREGLIRQAGEPLDAECWLRLILMHVAGGLSLDQTTVRALELGWAELSAVALFRRLLQAQPWLENLTQYVLREQCQRLGAGDGPFTY